jgi:hypothetical protein
MGQIRESGALKGNDRGSAFPIFLESMDMRLAARTRARVVERATHSCQQRSARERLQESFHSLLRMRRAICSSCEFPERDEQRYGTKRSSTVASACRGVALLA